MKAGWGNLCLVSEVSAYGQDDLIENGFTICLGNWKMGKKGIHETMGLRHWTSGHGGKWTLRGGKKTRRVLRLPEILALSHLATVQGGVAGTDQLNSRGEEVELRVWGGHGSYWLCGKLPEITEPHTEKQRSTEDSPQTLCKELMSTCKWGSCWRLGLEPTQTTRGNCSVPTRIWTSAWSHQPDWKASQFIGHWAQYSKRCSPVVWHN